MVQFIDNRPSAIAQRNLVQGINNDNSVSASQQGLKTMGGRHSQFVMSETGDVNGLVSKSNSSNSINVFQLVIDKDLALALVKEGYSSDRNFMSYKGDRSSNAAVAWKAHVGVKLKDRMAVINAVSPILKSEGISHKWEVTTNSEQPKFLTIYPPDVEARWSGILAEVEAVIGDVATVSENSCESVMESGRIQMRHGQITALSVATIRGAGIELTAKEASDGYMQAEDIQYYEIGSREKIKPGQAGELAFVGRAGACLFIMSKGPPVTAILIDDILTSDPRTTWNPNEVALPDGVKRTVEHDIEKEIVRLNFNFETSCLRINALKETELHSMSETDPALVESRNAKKGRETGRLNIMETKLLDIRSRASELLEQANDDENRVEFLNDKIEEIDGIVERIKGSKRTLDVTF